MPFIEVPDACLAVLRYSLGNTVFTNTLWFTKEGFGVGDMQLLAGVLDTSVGVRMRGQIADTVSYLGVRLYDMRSETGAVVERTTGAGVGSQTDEVLPLSNCMVLTLRSASRGRAARGRIYLAGFTETYVTDGVFDTVPIAAVKDIYDDLYAAVDTYGWVWVIAHRYTSAGPLATGVTYPIISDEVRSGIPGSQRRRNQRP